MWVEFDLNFEVDRDLKVPTETRWEGWTRVRIDWNAPILSHDLKGIWDDVSGVREWGDSRTGARIRGDWEAEAGKDNLIKEAFNKSLYSTYLIDGGGAWAEPRGKRSAEGEREATMNIGRKYHRRRVIIFCFIS